LVLAFSARVLSASPATWALSEARPGMVGETPEALPNWLESSLPRLRDLPLDLRFSKK
jgi:hypothetical protein